jgi:hypothetical protein
MALRISLTGVFPFGPAAGVFSRPPFVRDEVCAGIWMTKQQSKEVVTRARNTERMIDVSWTTDYADSNKQSL